MPASSQIQIKITLSVCPVLYFVSHNITFFIAAFRTNFEGTFLGEIINNSTTSPEASLSGNIGSFRDLVSHRYFIASPLLPLENEMLHFSGHSATDTFIVKAQNAGKGLDALQHTIDAFVHYVISESNGTFVPCDIQGTSLFFPFSGNPLTFMFKGIKDSDGILTLIDLQGHSTERYVFLELLPTYS